MIPTPIKLSPSDLTFLWDECPRCFYLKVARNIPRPVAPFPKVFGRIDKLMKGYYQGKSTSEVSPDLPLGQIILGEKWVTSAEQMVPDHASSVFFRGKFDSLIEFTDGSYGVIDFKTSEPRPEHVNFYRRQLHAYAFSLEHPKPGALALKPISLIGLLFVDPDEMLKTESGKLGYLGTATWLECQRDDFWFLDFIDQVVSVLERPYPPEPAEKCEWCKYRQASREHGY